MDSEELKELAELQHENAPLTRKNAYHVDAVWGGYKGGIAGLIAGLMIGALAGVIIGGIAAGGIALAAGGIAAESAGAIMAAGAVFGMMHGADKFERVGIAAGSSSAVGKKLEGRMKEYMRSVFVELKHEIRSLRNGDKAQAQGTSLSDIVKEKTLVDMVEEVQNDFRVQHCDENHCKDNPGKIVFWKIAAIGATIGAVAGAAMGYGLNPHAVQEMLTHVGGEKLLSNIGGQVTALAITGAAVGASFGINRDIFRKIYDVAENLFVGNIKFGAAPGKEKTPVANITAAKESAVTLASEEPESPALRAAPEDSKAWVALAAANGRLQRSENFFEERLMREMLLNMDHTIAVRQ